jgi:hypothetical protein
MYLSIHFSEEKSKISMGCNHVAEEIFESDKSIKKLSQLCRPVVHLGFDHLNNGWRCGAMLGAVLAGAKFGILNDN